VKIRTMSFKVGNTLLAITNSCSAWTQSYNRFRRLSIWTPSPWRAHTRPFLTQIHSSPRASAWGSAMS
jgi:hypothetical protein